MNEEELKKEIEKWSKGCNVNIDFPKGLKYCDGINLCKVCKTNLDLYEAKLKGFQEGKLEQKKEDLELMDKLLNNLGKHFKFVKGEASKCKDLDYFKATEDMERVSLGYIKQLQKEIGGGVSKE